MAVKAKILPAIRLAVAAVNSPLTYSITGVVTEADGTTAIAGVAIALGALTTTSGADGTYTLALIPSGAHGTLTATKTGYIFPTIAVADMSSNLTGRNFENAWYAALGISANCIAAYQAIGASDYATSKVNIVTPGTYDLAEVVGATNWDATNGWTAVTNRYFDTGITLQNTHTVIIRVNTTAKSYGFVISNGNYTAQTFGVVPSWNGAPYDGKVLFHQEKTVATNALGNHVLAIAGANGYVDGTLGVSNAAAPSGTLRILSTTTPQPYKIAAVSVYNAVLTQPQIAAIGTAMNALP